MNNVKINQILDTNGDYFKIIKSGLIGDLCKITSFLDDEYNNPSVKQRYWHVKNNKFGLIYCKSCNTNHAIWNRKWGYVCCSKICADDFNSFMVSEKFRMDGDNIKEQYRKTCLERYGVDHVSKSNKIVDKISKSLNITYANPRKSTSIKNKIKETLRNNHGVDNYAKSDEYKKSSRALFTSKFVKNLSIDYELVKFGVDIKPTTDIIYELRHLKCGNNFQINSSVYHRRKDLKLDICTICNPYYSNMVEKGKNTKISKGIQIPDHLLTPFRLYEKAVNKETYKFKKKLFSIWDGYDFYDGEYIAGNFNHKVIGLRPSIDHKISIFYGFKNNISIEIIGNLDNLCITKRNINSSKCYKTENEFLGYDKKTVS